MRDVILFGGKFAGHALLRAAAMMQTTERVVFVAPPDRTAIEQLKFIAPAFTNPHVTIPPKTGKQNEPFYRAIHHQKRRRK